VIAPDATRGLKALADKGKIVFKQRVFDPADLKGAYLVIAATADRKINAAVSSYCLKKNILVNIVDSPRECNFILPSIVRRGDLTIAISTNGVSPALSKKIRKDLESIFGVEYAALLKIMKKIRPQALKKVKSMSARKKFFNKMLEPGMLGLLKKHKTRQAMRKLRKYLDDAGT